MAYGNTPAALRAWGGDLGDGRWYGFKNGPIKRASLRPQKTEIEIRVPLRFPVRRTRGVWGGGRFRPSSSVSGKTRVLCQEPSRVGRRRRGLRVGAQRPHRHPGPHESPTVTSWWRRKTTNTWWAPWDEVEGLNGAPIGLNGYPLASRVEALKQRGGIKGCSDSNNKLSFCWGRW